MPQTFEKDLTRLDRSLAKPPSPQSFVLVGRRQLRSNNSWLHNSLRLVKGPAACTLHMNPRDAAALEFSADEIVVVRSRVGALSVRLAITDDVAAGVVSLPHG